MEHHLATRVGQQRVLVTGAAGFIGFHVALALAERGDAVIGLDNFNAYYDPRLKQARAAELAARGIEVAPLDLCDAEKLKRLVETHEVNAVVHLAAQAGVRHSLSHPHDYVSANLAGFVSLLEAIATRADIRLVFASSSSVYGLNRKIPFSVDDPTDSPVNLYGATKKANEAIAHAYHHLYRFPVTGLRFFTVYGPWGRPDMAYYRFAKQIVAGEEIPLFNEGQMRRDFTYIDDIVQGTIAALDRSAGYEIFNLGGKRPIALLSMVELLEKLLGKRAKRRLLPMQPGEVVETWADIHTSETLLGFSPQVPFEEGLSRFIDWFRAYTETT
jgi:UDP-glucuronate 4-epimerase